MKTISISDSATFVDDDINIDPAHLTLTQNGYVVVGGRSLLHRVIAGAAKGQVVDHVDGNRLNNQRANLRITTHQGNAQNLQSAQKNNKLGLRGVWQCPKTGRFRAAVTFNGKKRYAGYFSTPDEAATAAGQLRRDLGFLDSRTDDRLQPHDGSGMSREDDRRCKS